MILQIRLSLQFGTDTVAGMAIVQQIHRRMGITAPLFSSAWMVNGVKFEAMGQQARRSNPPHGIFYRQPGNMVMPIPQVIIRDIPANFYRPNLLNLLPAEVLQVLVGYMWISGDMPGYPHWVREASRSSLVLYYSPVPGSTDHGHLPSTLTLIQLGRGAYAPARMEIADDVINMSRMRGRAEPQQLAPIQILTVMDHEGTGTPISAWAGRGSSGNSDAGGTTGRSTRGGREPGGDPYQTPGGRCTTSFDDNQYPPLSGYGATTIDQSAYSPGSGNHGQTSAGQDVQWNTTPTPPAPQPYMQANASGPDLAAMSAQLAQALAAIQTLTQQNQELGQQNQVLGSQIKGMQEQMQRQQQVQQDQAAGEPMESSPPKRQKPEGVETRRLEPTRTSISAQAGNMGVDMDLSREGQVPNEEGNVMLQFINKESTRYALWPPLVYDTAKASNASERESRLPHQYLEQGGQELLCRQCPKSRGYEKPDRSGLDCRNTVGNGWDPGPPREGQHPTLGYKKLIDQGGRYSDVVIIHHHNTRNDWKAPSGKLRGTDSLHRYVTTF